MLSLCPFDISVGVWAFVIGLSQISSFFSWSGKNCSLYRVHKARHDACTHARTDSPSHSLTQPHSHGRITISPPTLLRGDNKVMCKILAQYIKACRRKVRKTGGRRPGRTESRTDGDPDGHHHTIIRPVWRRAYTNQGVIVKLYSMPPVATKSKKLFLASRSKSRSQGHWPWCHLQEHH